MLLQKDLRTHWYGHHQLHWTTFGPTQGPSQGPNSRRKTGKKALIIGDELALTTDGLQSNGVRKKGEAAWTRSPNKEIIRDDRYTQRHVEWGIRLKTLVCKTVI